MTPGEGAKQISVEVESITREMGQKLMSKAFKAQNELRNAELRTLTNASPSAPGSPPGVRSGNLRRNWNYSTSGGGMSITIKAEAQAPYAGYLEDGTSKMAARPFVDKILEVAEPKIESIFADL